MAGRLIVARMFDDAFADAKRQIQPAEGGIALFKPGDDAQRMQVVVEAEAEFAEGAVEGLFTRMAEGRMPNVVYQGQSLCEWHIQPQRRGQGPCDLRDLEGVREAAPEVIARHFAGQPGEDLGLAR